MTDKEKTIKELKEALDSLDITNKYRLNIIRAIEYLQEEPVSIWHDGCEIPKSETNILMIRKDEKDSNYPPIAECFHGLNSRIDGKNWGYYNGFCYNEIEAPYKWAYVDDFIALEEIPPKFPLISQKKCMYTKDDFTDEDRKVLCDGCEKECKYAQSEEPVNKDFELALAEMVDKAQKCVVEPWVVAAQWKDELIKLAKSEEPVSDECIYNRTLEERQMSCKFCSAACQVRIKEPVSNALEEELDKYIKANFTIDKEQLDKFGIEEKDYMYSMDKSDMLRMIRYFTGKYKVPESDDLDEAAKLYVADSLCITNEDDWDDAAIEALNMYKAGAKWQKEKDK